MRSLILSTLFLVCFSFQSYADTIYIQIPIEAEEKYTAAGFADDYLKATGEIFVLGNMLEEKGEDQMTGSSVVTEAQMIELKKKYSMIRYYIQTDKRLPAGWVEKIDLIE